MFPVNLTVCMCTKKLFTFSGREVLFKTCVAMKFIDDDDDDDDDDETLNVISTLFS